MRPSARPPPDDQAEPCAAHCIANRQNTHRAGLPAHPRLTQHPAEIPSRTQPAALGEAVQLSYADNRFRPLARRALMILRPPLVAMRARNPWVRLRLRLLG